MARFFIAGAFVLLVAAASARAQTPPPAFVTVDAFTVSVRTISVTGILDGGTQPFTRIVEVPIPNVSGLPSVAEQVRLCKDLILLAMSRPGEYRLMVGGGGAGNAVCGLSRVVP
jgi:hypothetical protein